MKSHSFAYDTPPWTSRQGHDLTICAASDAHYATGLRVALFSALEFLAQPARVVIVDMGLEDPLRLEATVSAHSHCIRCDCVDGRLDRLGEHQNLERLGLTPWSLERYGVATLVRLFLPDLLPDVRRVIFLDSDVLVRTAPPFVERRHWWCPNGGCSRFCPSDICLGIATGR